MTYTKTQGFYVKLSWNRVLFSCNCQTGIQKTPLHLTCSIRKLSRALLLWLAGEISSHGGEGMEVVLREMTGDVLQDNGLHTWLEWKEFIALLTAETKKKIYEMFS